MASKSAPKRASSGKTSKRAVAKASRQPKIRPVAGSEPSSYHLRLYVAGQTRKSLQAIANLKQICEQNLPGRYSIEVVDLLEHPELARSDQILAIPTLVRKLPQPIKKIIGDLSMTERVLVGLDVTPRTTPDQT